MVATTDQKARLLDLTTGVLELVRGGKRDADEVCDVLQVIKNQKDFVSVLGPHRQILAPKLEVFKTIKLGTGLKTADDFRNALKQGGCRISDWANDMLGEPVFTAAAEETDVDLVVVSVADLGFKNGAKRSDIYSRAQRLGLDLCPAEVGPQLRLQYKDQLRDEWLLIAMEPIADSDGYLGVFGVGHGDDGRYLSGSDGYSDRFWYSYYRWVFAPRK